MLVGILIGELIGLYFLSRGLTQGLYTLFLLLFRARSVAVSLLLLITFPGTVVHELAHLFTAEILRVRTGKMTLVPESIREANIQSGSVMIAETDPFRRYAIGLAPIFWGITILTAISYFLPPFMTSVFYSGIPIFQNMDFYYLLILGYCLFAVSNAMFPSPQDLKGFVPFAVVVSLFLIGGFVLGIRFTLTGKTLEVATTTLTTLVNSLTLVSGINILLLIVSWGLTRLFLRLFRLRLS
jgi:hypothetical protein